MALLRFQIQILHHEMKNQTISLISNSNKSYIKTQIFLVIVREVVAIQGVSMTLNNIAVNVAFRTVKFLIHMVNRQLTQTTAIQFLLQKHRQDLANDNCTS
jgi:type III secretory pathway component EscR